MFNFGIKRAKGKCQRLQRTNTSSYGLSPIIDHVTPLQWINITEDGVYANTILTYKSLVGAWYFWYLLLDIHYYSLVSRIGAVLFIHGIILRRWLGRSLKTLSPSSDFPYFSIFE